MRSAISRPMLERLPMYASCIERLIETGSEAVSSAKIAKELALGEVQVRKELALVSGSGKPRIGYDAKKLLADIRSFLGENQPCEAVIIGAGRLGRALLGYSNFEEFGVRINTAFDLKEPTEAKDGEQIYGLDRFASYCKEHAVKIGIITVPASSAQSVCDIMLKSGIKAIWNFAPTTLEVPSDVSVINEKLAISLSQLRQQIQ